jgi:hypothetical protein
MKKLIIIQIKIIQKKVLMMKNNNKINISKFKIQI